MENSLNKRKPARLVRRGHEGFNTFKMFTNCYSMQTGQKIYNREREGERETESYHKPTKKAIKCSPVPAI